MNKLTKITVISAVLMTSGFAQQQATISGDITNNYTFEIGNGITVAMADGSVIHNYGNIKGSGEIYGTAEATIINYNHIVEVTENDPTCFRPIGGGSIADSINKTNVTVTDQKADISVSFDDSNKAGNTILLTTDICDADTDKILTMTNTSEIPVDVLADIANELNGSGTSHSLRVVGNVRLMGDQSEFNQPGTECNITGENTRVEVASPNGFPQVPVKVNDESEININASVVNITKDIMVVASQFNIAPKGHFRLDKATLYIKGPVQVFTSEAASVLTSINPENIDTIAVYERKEGAVPPLVALRTSSLNSVAKSGRAVTENVIDAEAAYVYGPNSVSSNDTVWTKAMLKGSSTSGYKLVSDNEILREVGGLLKSGKSWTNLDAYCLQKWPYTIVPADTTGLSNIDWDTNTSWLFLERNTDITSGLFAIRKKTVGSDTHIGLLETNIALLYNETKSPELLDVPVGEKDLVRLVDGVYKGEKNNAILEEIDSLLKAGKTWKNFATCKDNSVKAQGLSIDNDNKITTAKNKDITDVVIPYGVTSIGNFPIGSDQSSLYSTMGVFDSCEILNNVIIPDSVRSIGTCAFRYCKSLTTIIIPDSVISIGHYAFESSGLTSIKWSKSTEEIGHCTFRYCHLLVNITIPNTVKSIGNYAFESCSFTNVTIPASVESIKGDAFSHCSKLKILTLPTRFRSMGFSYIPQTCTIRYEDVDKECQTY